MFLSLVGVTLGSQIVIYSQSSWAINDVLGDLRSLTVSCKYPSQRQSSFDDAMRAVMKKLEYDKCMKKDRIRSYVYGLAADFKGEAGFYDRMMNSPLYSKAQSAGYSYNWFENMISQYKPQPKIVAQPKLFCDFPQKGSLPFASWEAEVKAYFTSESCAVDEYEFSRRFKEIFGVYQSSGESQKAENLLRWAEREGLITGEIRAGLTEEILISCDFPSSDGRVLSEAILDEARTKLSLSKCASGRVIDEFRSEFAAKAQAQGDDAAGTLYYRFLDFLSNQNMITRAEARIYKEQFLEDGEDCAFPSDAKNLVDASQRIVDQFTYSKCNKYFDSHFKSLLVFAANNEAPNRTNERIFKDVLGAATDSGVISDSKRIYLYRYYFSEELASLQWYHDSVNIDGSGGWQRIKSDWATCESICVRQGHDSNLWRDVKNAVGKELEKKRYVIESVCGPEAQGRSEIAEGTWDEVLPIYDGVCELCRAEAEAR
jgi:hypothetical protein